MKQYQMDTLIRYHDEMMDGMKRFHESPPLAVLQDKTGPAADAYMRRCTRGWEDFEFYNRATSLYRTDNDIPREDKDKLFDSLTKRDRATKTIANNLRRSLWWDGKLWGLGRWMVKRLILSTVKREKELLDAEREMKEMVDE